MVRETANSVLARETMPGAAVGRRRRKDARPSELTAAALDLFVERGFAGTRLEDIAARAGVAKGTVYLYFASKEALFKAVIQEGMEPALAAAEEQVASYAGSTANLLQALLFAWWEQIGSTRLAGVVKLIVSEARTFPGVAQYYHDHVIGRARSLLRTALQHGVRTGEFRALNVEASIDVALAPLLMLSIWSQSLAACGNDIDAVSYLETHIDLLLNGICSREHAA